MYIDPIALEDKAVFPALSSGVVSVVTNSSTVLV
jgi:hypothetical protein